MLRLFLLLAASGAFLKTYAPLESSEKPCESNTMEYDPFATVEASSENDNDLSGSRNTPPRYGSGSSPHSCNPFDQLNRTTEQQSYYLLIDNNSENLQKIKRILEINDQTPLLEIAQFLGNTKTETIALKRSGIATLEYSESKDLYYCTLPQSITTEVMIKIAQHHRIHNRHSNPKLCIFAQNAQNISPYAYFVEIQPQQGELQPKIIIEKTLTYTAPNTVPSSEKEFDSYLTRQLSNDFSVEFKNPKALFSNEEMDLYEAPSEAVTSTSHTVDTGMDSVNIFQLTALTKFAHAKHAPWVELFDDAPSSISKVNEKVYFNSALNMYFAMFSKNKDQQLSPTMAAILEHARSRSQTQESINILASFSISSGQSTYTSYLARFFHLKPTKSGAKTSYSLKAYKIPTSLNRAPKTKEEEYIEEKVKEILAKTTKKSIYEEDIVRSHGLYKQFTQYMDESYTGTTTLGMQDIKSAITATGRFLAEETIAPWHRMLAMFKFGSFEKNGILYKPYGKSAIAVAETEANTKTIEQTIENARKILDKGQNTVHLFLNLKNGDYVSPVVYHLEITVDNIKEKQAIKTKINPSATTSQEAKISEVYKSTAQKLRIISSAL